MHHISTPALAESFGSIGSRVGAALNTQVAILNVNSILAGAHTCGTCCVRVGTSRALSTHSIVFGVSADALTSTVPPDFVDLALTHTSVVEDIECGAWQAVTSILGKVRLGTRGAGSALPVVDISVAHAGISERHLSI